MKGSDVLAYLRGDDKHQLDEAPSDSSRVGVNGVMGKRLIQVLVGRSFGVVTFALGSDDLKGLS